MNGKPFFDTNLIIYAFREDDPRCEVARVLLATGGVISVQVLNELVAVLRRKLNFSWDDVLAAVEAKSKTLYSEDMNDGQEIEGTTISNPFTKRPGC